MRMYGITPVVSNPKLTYLAYIRNVVPQAACVRAVASRPSTSACQLWSAHRRHRSWYVARRRIMARRRQAAASLNACAARQWALVEAAAAAVGGGRGSDALRSVAVRCQASLRNIGMCFGMLPSV